MLICFNCKPDVCFYCKGSCSVRHHLRLESCLSWTQKTKMIGIFSLLQLSIHGLAISQPFWSKGGSGTSCWRLRFPILVPGWQSFRELWSMAAAGGQCLHRRHLLLQSLYFFNGSSGLALTDHTAFPSRRSLDAVEQFLFPKSTFLRGNSIWFFCFFCSVIRDKPIWNYLLPWWSGSYLNV